jgi:hypothetical protein
MQRTMQRHCIVFRNGKLLADGLSALDDVIAMVWDDPGAADRSMIFNTDLVETRELGAFADAFERGCLDTDNGTPILIRNQSKECRIRLMPVSRSALRRSYARGWQSAPAPLPPDWVRIPRNGGQNIQNPALVSNPQGDPVAMVGIVTLRGLFERSLSELGIPTVD